MKRKSLWVFLLIVAAIAVAAWVYLNPSKRSVSDEKGIEVSAVQLVKDYQANEAEANAKYLDKAIEVSGTVTAVDKNQDGKLTVMLASEDPMSGVYCTLKENTEVASGASVTIKGFCSGMLSDVRIREAVIENDKK